jgi:hypothetical protein
MAARREACDRLFERVPPDRVINDVDAAPRSEAANRGCEIFVAIDENRVAAGAASGMRLGLARSYADDYCAEGLGPAAQYLPDAARCGVNEND